jgi:hypothetical protein
MHWCSGIDTEQVPVPLSERQSESQLELQLGSLSASPSVSRLESLSVSRWDPSLAEQGGFIVQVARAVCRVQSRQQKSLHFTPYGWLF